jgi:Carboxypeptidase regulatory-like domain/TonB-dependent Receptor Plug Domain
MQRGLSIRRLSVALILMAVSGRSLWAQGVQTGVLTGRVTSTDGAALADAAVTAKSPSLQGARTVKTDALGAYILKGLPPGRYTITYAHDSFANAERQASVGVGESLSLSVALAVAGPSEVVTVLAAPDAAPVQTSSGGQNFRADDIDRLSIARDPINIATLAPGLTTNGPNNTSTSTSELSISGGFAYENQFLLDGVDASDNVFGDLQPLYVEDAISEVQVLTSGISAEYGHFGGGVLNAVTKSGGNQFTGSFRTDFSNQRWIAQTPFEIENNRPQKQNKVQPTFQATLGGYVVKDRLWFFTAGRLQDRDTENTLDQTAIPFTTSSDDKRFEVKLTGAITPQHTVQATYVRDQDEVTGSRSLGHDIDPASLVNPQYPTSLLVAHYTGVLRPNLSIEAQVSRKKEGFRDNGGTSTSIFDSPFLPLTLAGDTFNGPYFDATDPEDRDNRQITGALSYFLSTRDLGRHDIKVGVENFRTHHTGGNSQSSTNYVFISDYQLDDAGKPLLQDNRLVPVFVPDQSLILNWRATRGATLDLTTNSFYVNDHWSLKHWSFNLGGRFESVRSQSTDGILGVDTTTIVPRLAASYDLSGDGKWRFDATYGQYAGKYTDSQFALNSKVGNPDLIIGLYTGPEGSGRDFAPGFDTTNYVPVGGNFPTKNVTFDKGLSSPVTNEVTLGVGHEFGRGYAKLIYTHRRTTKLIEDFIDLSNGITDVTEDGQSLVTLTNRVFRNSDVPQRRYDAVQILSEYRPFQHLWLTGSYTMQLKNEGDFEGEAAGQPGLSSDFGDYPEIFSAARNFPIGNLSSFQRSRLRLYGRYTFDFGKGGTLDVGGLFSYDSPLTYSFVAGGQDLSAVQLANNPGYPDLPTSQNLYFDKRGTGSYNASHIFDLAVYYNVPVVGRLRPYLKAQVRNLFASMPLTGFDTTIIPNADGPLDANGLPTTFTKGPKFGQATTNNDFPLPRTFLFSLGASF